MRLLGATLLGLLLAAMTGIAFSYSGLVYPGADQPHSRPVLWLMENLRRRGVEAQVKGIGIPNLADPALIRMGAGNYDAMCATCHLKPGTTDSEMHRGLYPQPPAFSGTSRPTPPRSCRLDHQAWHQGFRHAGLGQKHG